MISKSELKFIRSLKIKKYRLAEGAFLIEGEKNVLELIQSDYKILRIIGTESFFNDHSNCLNHQMAIQSTSKIVSDISSLKNNNRVVAVAEMKHFTTTDLEQDKFILALDGLSDPGNLGTIMRTLDWFGFNQVVCSLDSVDVYNPKVISATMGSFCRVKVVQTDLSSFLDQFEGRVVGAEMNGQTLDTLLNRRPGVLVMGSESHGIRSNIKDKIDDSVTIPRIGNAESLNVGVATGILCHQLIN